MTVQQESAQIMSIMLFDSLQTASCFCFAFPKAVCIEATDGRGEILSPYVMLSGIAPWLTQGGG